MCRAARQATKRRPGPLGLLDAAPLRVATRSRLERGCQLSGRAPDAATAGPLALEPSMTVEMVLQGVGLPSLNHLLRNEPAAIAGEGETLHQMRVAVRRLRSMLGAVRPMLCAFQG